jgi:hypothetical protein
MQTARVTLQGLYSLLAGLVLLIGVPVYQAIVLGPAGYRAPSDTAFNHADYGPLLLWISNHGGAFTVFRLLELLTFLLALRLPFALYRVFRSYGSTLARWMVVCGLVGLVLFAAILALSTVSFINAAASYSQASSAAAAKAIASDFSSLYGIEGLAQNTLGGALLALFLLCASLLFARSGKMQGLLVYFGLLAAALMAALALLFAVSAPDAQTQLTTPALAAFAAWLIWLGILLMRRAPRLVAASPSVLVSAPAPQTASGTEAAPGTNNTPAQAPVTAPLAETPPPASTAPDPDVERVPPNDG